MFVYFLIVFFYSALLVDFDTLFIFSHFSYFSPHLLSYYLKMFATSVTFLAIIRYVYRPVSMTMYQLKIAGEHGRFQNHTPLYFP